MFYVFIIVLLFHINSTLLRYFYLDVIIYFHFDERRNQLIIDTDESHLEEDDDRWRNHNMNQNDEHFEVLVIKERE